MARGRESQWSSDTWCAGDVAIPVPSSIKGSAASGLSSRVAKSAKVPGPCHPDACDGSDDSNGDSGQLAANVADHQSPGLCAGGDACAIALKAVLSTLEDTLLYEHKRVLRLQEKALRHMLAQAAGPPSGEVFSGALLSTQFAEAGTQTLLDYEAIWEVDVQPRSPELRQRSPATLDSQRSQENLGRSVSPCTPASEGIAKSAFSEDHTHSKNFESTKSKLAEILKRQEDLEDLHRATDGEAGRWRLLANRSARGWLVDQCMGVVILANTLLIGVRCDVALGWHGWLILDAVFALIFVVELLFKVCTFGVTHVFCGYDWRWGWFEAILALAAWIEIMLAFLAGSEGSSAYNLSVFRVVRLFRITRVIQVVRFQIFGDLLMIQGALGSLRTLMWSAVRIACPVYALALFMRVTVGSVSNPGAGALHFTSLGDSLFTVFRCVVAGDCTNEDGQPIFVIIAGNYGWGYGVLYTFSYTFMTFGLFNVIVAIYVENTVAAAKYNTVYMKRGRLEDQKLLAEKSATLVRLVWEIFQEWGKTDDKLTCLPSKPTVQEISDMASQMQITPEIFDELRKQPRFQEVLTDLGVSDEDQVDLFETLDIDGSGSIDLQELIFGISKLRGDARRADVVAVSLMMRSVQHALLEFEARVSASLQAQEKRLRAMVGGGGRSSAARKRADYASEERSEEAS